MKENMKISELINDIEPSEGARERMLANIRNKAANHTNENTQEFEQKNNVIEFKLRRAMKWILPAAACIIVTVIGVLQLPKISKHSNANNSKNNVDAANPFVSVDNAKEFDEKLGIVIEAPSGAENIEYVIIDDAIADIFFSYEGHYYDLRASFRNGDFSGIYGTEVKENQIDAYNDSRIVSVRDGDETYRKVIWTDGKITYILTNIDGASEEDIKAVYNKIKNKK